MSRVPFIDGLKSLVSSIANSRSAAGRNTIQGELLTWEQQRHIYRTGIGNKIVRLKAGDALAPDALQFERKEDQEWFDRNLSRQVRQVTKWMLAFGRGIVVLQDPGGDLRRPLSDRTDRNSLILRVFSGDMVTTAHPDVNLESPRYLLPNQYYVRGVPIHHSRVVDFTYVEPPEYEAPLYQYGGISEFELVHQQLLADGVVERATPSILEKNSTLFYKVKGFHDAMQAGNEDQILKFFNLVEDQRSIYGAGIIDSEDEVQTVDQTLTNLSEADQITLRRLAMVTGISITRLVGEAVRGLNSSGETERDSDRATISALQNDYVLPPLKQLFHKLERGDVWFGQALAESPGEQADYERKVLENATLLYDLGEDHESYLEDKGVVQQDAWDRVFPAETKEDEPEEPSAGAGVMAELLGLEEGDSGSSESQE